jgi:transcriptional regulator with XRE-family HTH domain
LESEDFSKEEIARFYKMVGLNVKKYRRLQKMTQMQLALAINHSSVGHIAKAELYRYGKHFSLEQLFKISKILKVEVAVFFQESPPSE